VVLAGLELVALDSVVDALHVVFVDVDAVVDALGHFEELFELHAFTGLHVRVVDARVEQDYGVGEHIYGLVGAVEERLALVVVALDVAEREGVDEVLDLLGLAGHAEMGLELAEGFVYWQALQVDQLDQRT